MKKIIYFDGVCNLCNGFVSLIIKLDHKEKFSFAPLQGKTAQLAGLEFEKLPMDEQSLYYQDEKDQIYTKFKAVVEILIELFTFGFIFKILRLLPDSFGDFLYGLVAKNRYRLFGKQSTCRIPSESEKKRFLE